MTFTARSLMLGILLVFGIHCHVFADQEKLDQIDVAGLDYSAWVSTQSQQAWYGILRNISISGAAPGSVVASPSQSNPNYFFHWTRDAALTIDYLTTVLEQTTDTQLRLQLQNFIANYALLSRNQQRASNRSGEGDFRALGEPKFEMNGQPFLGEWGRPQNDGPALRALALIRFSWYLLNHGQQNWVQTYLYDSRLPSDSVIKMDLEYISRVWNEGSFDIWEENFAHHFYTRLVIWQALAEGARLARFLNDESAAQWYESKLQPIEQSIAVFFDGGIIQVMLPVNQNTHSSGLDIAVLLAVLHTQGIFHHPLVSIFDEKLITTVDKLVTSFRGSYAINSQTVDREAMLMGPAIGRYPEDHYDGVATNTLGNAWVLATAALAEWHYLMRKQLTVAGRIYISPHSQRYFNKILNQYYNTRETVYIQQGEFNQNSSYFQELLGVMQIQGDSYLRRIKFHARPDGSLFEQMHRQTGYMTGAYDLTWSFVSFLTALRARN